MKSIIKSALIAAGLCLGVASVSQAAVVVVGPERACFVRHGYVHCGPNMYRVIRVQHVCRHGNCYDVYCYRTPYGQQCKAMRVVY